MLLKLIFVVVAVVSTLHSCKKNHDFSNSALKQLRFKGEKVLKSTAFGGFPFGGLSGIDYHKGKWYAVSDDPNGPVRFYTLFLNYDNPEAIKASVEKVTVIKNHIGAYLKKGSADPESLRFDPEKGTFIWVSEGIVDAKINPSVSEITADGQEIRTLPLPDLLRVGEISDDKGPRHNGTLEGLSLSINGKGYWIGMELPLLQDGDLPAISGTYAPVRISLIDKKTGNVQKQVAYMLDNLVREARPASGFKVNGLVELLALNDYELLVLERSFASGWQDGGNNVKIYLIDISKATDIKHLDNLRIHDFIPVQKKLIFDFESIRSKLTNGIVDNIEGMTFGPDLQNGNQSLVVIADNNFNEFSLQLNQIIVFEVLK